jgi:hypothetical protein
MEGRPMSNVLVDLADKLGFLAAIRDKLFPDPPAEYSQLAGALREFSSSFRDVDELLSRLLSLSFVADERRSLDATRALLIQIEGGEAMLRAANLRTQCNALRVLYDHRLSHSLAAMLTPAESRKAQDAFGSLEKFHEEALPELQALVAWASALASKLLEMLYRSEFDRAEDLLKQARGEVLPQRQAMARAVEALLELQSAYVSATRSLKAPKHSKSTPRR